MNKFLRHILWDKGNLHRRDEKPVSPMMGWFNSTEFCEYNPMKMQTLYQLKLQFTADVWLSNNQEKNETLKEECRANVAKRLHHEIFGDIEAYLHELQLHLHNQDFESSKKTVDLIKAVIKGD